MRMLCVFALLLASCAQSLTLPTDDPHEQHVLSETARFSAVLGKKITAEVTDEVYMVPASRPSYPGEKVPAAGWYYDGHIKYWRPVIRERSLEYGTQLAAEEVCHSITRNHDAKLQECINMVINGTT